MWSHCHVAATEVDADLVESRYVDHGEISSQRHNGVLTTLAGGMAQLDAHA